MPDVKHFDPERVLDEVLELFWRRGASTTGVGEIVAVTGLSRSSLYATFGGKRELYLAALRRYVDQRSRPAMDVLVADDDGLPAIAGFFDRLIQARCEGPRARWGCMASNAHADNFDDAEVRQVLDDHHERLRSSMRSALETARSRGQLRPGIQAEASADVLVLLAYGVNLRSRAGAPAADLRATVTSLLETLSASETPAKEK